MQSPKTIVRSSLMCRSGILSYYALQPPGTHPLQRLRHPCPPPPNTVPDIGFPHILERAHLPYPDARPRDDALIRRHGPGVIEHLPRLHGHCLAEQPEQNRRALDHGEAVPLEDRRLALLFIAGCEFVYCRQRVGRELCRDVHAHGVGAVVDEICCELERRIARPDEEARDRRCVRWE
ncbi:hypothetical protein B0H10DRAFT_5435 [Mycena sp. CBHHK59/15]|nr:hypothetical protein B0H10DRAFT_5435 [Mycena sp. CBHHK59/15]